MLPLIAIAAASGGIYLLLSLCASSLRRRLIEKHTGVADLPFLGSSRPKERKIQGVAVVCGGSIAGLVTARVCHDHFERVIIVEPEACLTTPEGWEPDQDPKNRKRARVMQYQFAHALLSFGFTAFEKLFPTLRAECQNCGIRVGPADFNLAFRGNHLHLGGKKGREALPNTLFSTRHGLETLLRRLVIGYKQYPNIEQVVGTVTGIVSSESDSNRLQGVTVRTNDGEIMLPAALVIDCTGTSQTGLKFLQRAGFGAVNGGGDLRQLRISYDPQIRYSNLQFTITPKLAERLSVPGGYYNSGGIYYGISEASGMYIAMIRCEGDTFQLGVGARGDMQFPKNLADIKAFARDMILDKPLPEWFFSIMDELEEVEASMTVDNANLPPLSYIRYHQARGLPSNWIAIGDSVMKVNPVYGHGCSKAAIGAATLNTVLRTLDSPYSSPSVPDNLSRRFFDAQATKIDPIWEGTKAIDYGYACTTPVPGETLSNGWFIRWYSYQLNLVAFRDQEASLTVLNSIQLLSPSAFVLAPAMVWKVFCDILTRPFA